MNIIELASIPSSNDYVLEHLSTLVPGSVVVAITQSKGKGTNGRTWISPPGNLYFSLYKKLVTTQADLRYLAINVAIKIAEALQEVGVSEIGLKWPNDLFLHTKKIGGVLIETKNSREQGFVDVVIGVGLNLVPMPECAMEITQAYTSLATEGYILERHKLLLCLLEKINSAQQLQA